MAKTFHKFPSIGKFSDLIKQVHANSKYHNEPVPKLNLTGTVKLHGTNAGICSDGIDVWLQTRERILPDEESHMGFREYFVRNEIAVRTMLSYLMHYTGKTDIQIYGEWCGGNIQKGVGLTRLPKMFVIFAVGVGVPPETGHRTWMTDDQIHKALGDLVSGMSETHLSTGFNRYRMTVDFDRATMSQNELIDLTIAVETDCPVSRQLLGADFEGELIGEGIVWTAYSPTLGTQRIKVKGEKHSASKVRTLAPVDEELVKGIEEFVTYAVTDNRLEQGVSKMREMGIDPTDRKNIGEYVKWVVGDAVREEMSVLANSGLEVKQVSGLIARKASAYIKTWQESPEALEEVAA